MSGFKIKRIFILNYKKKLAISGVIENDIKPILEFKRLEFNDFTIPIEEINEVLIDNYSYLTFTFDLDTFDEELLIRIKKFKEGQIIEIS